MAKTSGSWTNPSVIRLSAGTDPVEKVTSLARSVVLHALDLGWKGPPFDPIELAELLNVKLRASTQVRDARLSSEGGVPVVDFNPTRPRARARYSIAHECAHLLFPDWAEAPRNRSATHEMVADEWELESLCNLAAAEYLMPYGSLRHDVHSQSTVDELLEARKRFDVSVEAMFIRAVNLAEGSCSMFVASEFPTGMEVEYCVSSPAWRNPLGRGDAVPSESVVARCKAIGHTLKGIEHWPGMSESIRIEAVGIPGFPGSSSPRVVAWCREVDPTGSADATIEYLRGDATKPARIGAAMIAHVVPDSVQVWGGQGFAAALRREFPEAQEKFRAWKISSPASSTMGAVHFCNVRDGIEVASIVAQKGFGPSVLPRIRYESLAVGLREVVERAAKSGATLHMPRIGAGSAGGNWDIIEDLLRSALIGRSVSAMVYDLPRRP